MGLCQGLGKNPERTLNLFSHREEMQPNFRPVTSPSSTLGLTFREHSGMSYFLIHIYLKLKAHIPGNPLGPGAKGWLVTH